MESKNRAGTKCSNCQFFSPDGCRYGYCRVLNVTVEGKWSPCALSVAAFDCQKKSPDLAATAV
jgi:hypothetical protein